MPRSTRLIPPGVPLHLIQRGNNRQPCFLDDADRVVYMNWLAEYAALTECRIHAYVLTSNHVHLLISTSSPKGAGSLMKALGQRYAHYFNRKYLRTGTVWEGRYKSSAIQDETYLLVCQRYIELNPVRAKMVDYPAHYRWCSYRHNAEGRRDALVTPHELYQRLAPDAAARQQAYQSLFRDALDPGTLDRVRRAINNNAALGTTLSR